METMTDNNELEQMKGQLGVLKDKLDKESLVNDRIMKKIMKTKVRSIKHIVYLSYFIIIACIFFCSWMFISILDTSWAFAGATILFMLIAIVYTYEAHKEVTAKDLLDGNLLDVSRKMLRVKRMNAQWLKFGIPCGIGWVIWFLIEMPKGADFKEDLLSIVIGAVIGALIGSLFYRKRQRAINDVLEQIDELTKE
jgi:hypothetical protein